MQVGNEPRRLANQADAASTVNILDLGRPYRQFFLTNNTPNVAAREAGRRDPVAEALARGDIEAPWILEARPDPGGDRHEPGEPELEHDARRLRLEIPGSAQAVKERDPGAAVAWREATRAAFTTYLDRGWFVRECLRTRGGAGEPRRTVYLLEKGSCEPEGLAG